jgi:hypothetical protein
MRKSHVGGNVAGVGKSHVGGGVRRSVVRRCIAGGGMADVSRSRIGGSVAGVGKSRVGGGARRSAVRRRAVGGGVASVRKIHVEDGVRRNTARRHGVGADVVEEEGRLHKKSSHGGKERGEGGVGRRRLVGVGERPTAAMVEREERKLCRIV